VCVLPDWLDLELPHACEQGNQPVGVAIQAKLFVTCVKHLAVRRLRSSSRLKTGDEPN